MPGAVLLVGRRSQAVDQSSARNKRNDRLAEGHERVAGTVMVLRGPGPCTVGREGATVYIGAPRSRRTAQVEEVVQARSAAVGSSRVSKFIGKCAPMHPQRAS